MQQPAYITLQNINPAQNKRRVYTITVTGFSVQLCWGRMGCHTRQKAVTFREEAEVLKFLRAALRKRERHGYGVVGKGAGFPDLGVLVRLEAERFEPVQLRLFGEQFPFS